MQLQLLRDFREWGVWFVCPRNLRRPVLSRQPFGATTHPRDFQQFRKLYWLG